MLTKHRSQAGSVHIVLLLGAVLVVVAAVGYFTYARIQHDQKIAKERALYAAADKEAGAYIDAIAAKYPGEAKSLNRCWRTSAKYSEGSLGCSVGRGLEVVLAENINETNVVDLAEKEAVSLTAGRAEDTTAGNQRNTSRNYLKSLVYKKENKTCSVAIKYKDIGNGANSDELVLEDGHKILEIQAGCSGPALAEYY